MKSILFTLCFCLFSVGAAFAADRDWSDDYAKALEQAAKQQKLVLLRFNLADSNSPLGVKYNKAFSKLEFRNYAKKNLVLVKADYYMKGSPLRPEVKAQNEMLRTKYDVKGYPAALLLDAQGKELERWEGIHGDGDHLLEEILPRLTARINNK